ncbi:MAG: NADH:flavin oxidoreductase [Clostridiales bacterium]
MEIIELTKINRCFIKNRIFRSATYEGMCDLEGIPLPEYIKYYEKLAKSSVGAIITGFSYVSKEGKSIQQRQSAIDEEKMIHHFSLVTDKVHNYGCRIFIQLSHAGRQTRKINTGFKVYGFSNKKSFYFNEKPMILNKDLIKFIVKKFGESAFYAKKAGFDGIQIQSGHGYLVHQSILSSINNREDEFGVDINTKIGINFLSMIIDEIREKCGEYFPILVKISSDDDYFNSFSKQQFTNLIKFLDSKEVDAIEISNGTMDFALNIFRGGVPLKTIMKYNPILKYSPNMVNNMKSAVLLPFLKSKIKSFKPVYNLEYAKIAKSLTKIPIICVGGFRSETEIFDAITNNYCDYVSLSRPFICEHDFVEKIIDFKGYQSKCTNCNMCAVMCDSGKPTKCYLEETEK